MAAPSFQLGRALLTGLTLGLAATALMLGGFAWQGTHTPCEYPGTTQCEFETRLAADVARLQLFAGAGCLLVATGLALFLRRRTE